MPKLLITSPVEHDGKALEVGEEITLSGSQAEALVALGAAEVKGAKKPAEGEAGENGAGA